MLRKICLKPDEEDDEVVGESKSYDKLCWIFPNDEYLAPKMGWNITQMDDEWTRQRSDMCKEKDDNRPGEGKENYTYTLMVAWLERELRD